ncbi:MAG: GNAT family N-acetyltransferase [Vicinamibacterales bacterium]|nr:GNAT family N-acetyltransferase [Vicinamibacterales bacterium]
MRPEHPAIDPHRVTLRPARPDEIDTLVAIDDEASALYAAHGLALGVTEEHPFAEAERARWLAAAQAARAFLAVSAAGVPLGFAALDLVDGAPYLDQLAVHPAAMRRGVGRALLARAIAWAEAQGAGALWLTTYAHLPFNRPYYERAGFVVVPEAACGPGIRHHLAEQRCALPAPEQRVAMRLRLKGDAKARAASRRTHAAS